MTYITGSGNSSGQAPPYSSPPAAANVAQTTPAPPTYNSVHNITSTSEALNNVGETVVQQGLPYVTNSSSVILAGLRPQDFAYYHGLDHKA